jgi:hypothetical protein
MKMKAVRSSEMLITIYETTRRHNPPQSNLTFSSKRARSFTQSGFDISDICVRNKQELTVYTPGAGP